tara:strand:+ start:16542 stop:17312 length:771 start_codon:yes stop_codon:yes gene_type:complete
MLKLEKLNNKVVELDNKIWSIRVENENSTSTVLKNSYFPFIDEVKFAGEDYIYLNNKDGKEICTLSLRKKHWNDVNFNYMEIGYYSTRVSTNDSFEMDRLITLGKITEIVKTNSESILFDIHNLRKENSKEISKLSKEKYSLEKEINTLNKEIKDKAKEENLKTLFNGTNIEPTYIQVRGNTHVSNVKNIKFKRWTNDTKRSLTIEFTCDHNIYNFEEEKYNTTTRVFEYDKVRLDNVRHFICDLNEFLPKVKELV